MADVERKTGGEVLERTKPKVQQPALYRVILHNDDYTTMDFVIEVLESIFNKSPAEAYRLMMQVHTQGQALCGMYPYDIAETKVTTVHELAREQGFPLRASMEAE
jgi:ATP-dependent Clp protease adaptor protein ClpS